MNLLQRIKDGASRVSEKAQSSVEVSKLNGQISDLEHEMQVEFLKMGKLFYEGYRSRDLSAAEGPMVELARACNKLQEQIDGVRARIAELKNERLCTCGRVVALDANFCPHCGRKLEPVPLRKEPAADATAAPSTPAPEAKVHTILQHDDEEDQFYGEEELTEEERELARRMEPRTPYASVLPEIEQEEEPEAYEPVAAGGDRGRRDADELERERERQLELDRRIRDWEASRPADEPPVLEGETREIVKCQICRADLPKGSMWCPRCGSEQI